MEARLNSAVGNERKGLGGGPLLRNFSLQLGGELTGQAIAFVAAIYLARTLDAHGFGVWVFASSVLLYFTIVIDGGTDIWGMREVAARPRRLRLLVGAIIRSRLLLGAAAIGAVIVLAQLVDHDNSIALLVGLPILIAFIFNTAWAHRGLETGLTGVTIVLQRATWLSLALLLIKAPSDANFATFWQGISEVVGVGILLIFLVPRLRALSRKSRQITVRTVFAHSWPLALTRAMRALTVTLAVVVLTFSGSDAEVGYYGSALRVATVLLLVSTVFTNAAFPGLARACRGPDQAAVMNAAMRLLVTVVAPIAVCGVILADPILRLLFPPQFGQAAIILAILMPALAAMAVSDLLRRILAARHRQRLDSKLTAVVTIASVVVTSSLAILFGGVGAAIAMLLGELALVALSLWAVARTGPRIAILRAGSLPLVGALVMGAALAVASNLPLFPRVLVGAFAYLTWLAFFSGHLREDLKRINGATVGPARPAEHPAIS